MLDVSGSRGAQTACSTVYFCGFICPFDREWVRNVSSFREDHPGTILCYLFLRTHQEDHTRQQGKGDKRGKRRNAGQSWQESKIRLLNGTTVRNITPRRGSSTRPMLVSSHTCDNQSIVAIGLQWEELGPFSFRRLVTQSSREVYTGWIERFQSQGDVYVMEDIPLTR
jgi:hypothetical protein